MLDHLEIDRAHLVGASMGGMIAQIFAVRHSHRTHTLAVMSSSTNQRALPPPDPRALLPLMDPRALLPLITGPSPDSPREVILDVAVRFNKTIGSPRYPTSEERLRAYAIEQYDRCYYPAGIGRHFAAVLGSGSLLPYNRQITAPTVVIHGNADKLIRPAGGRAIAKAINGARLVLIDGMGHELPEQLWDHVIGELKTNFSEAF